MPSSRARRRRAQQRRGTAAQTPPRRPPAVAQPAEPEPVEAQQPLDPAAEAFEEPVGVEADGDLDDDGEFEPDDGEDDGDEGEDETLEEQEADVEEAAAELDRTDPEPAPRGRRSGLSVATPVAERARPVTRAPSRNRRRGATPQPQGPALVRFFRETFDELRKVDWPSPSELYRYTIIVIITVIVLAAFISGLDWVLQQLAEKFVYGSAGAAG